MNDKGESTFRKWNPKKIDLPYGQDTSADEDETCSDSLCCILCKCVNKVMNAAFEEVIDFVEEGSHSPDVLFNKNEKFVKTAGSIIRPVSILACILGFYLLFSPVIALLSWIPLVGGLLSYVFALAAFLFALVVGGTVACLVLGLAWLYFRPVVGVTLLVLTAGGIALIFLYPTGAAQP